MKQAGGIVMVVEDDPDIRETLAQILEEEGYATLVARNGAEALRALGALERSRLPAVILLDLMMPEMDGPEFRDEQRRRDTIADVPVVIVSADAQIEKKAEVLDAAAFVRKPVSFDALLRVIERFATPARTAGVGA